MSGTQDPSSGDLSRREFIAGVGAAAGAIVLGGCGASSNGDPELDPLPAPERSGIEHVVVVMMENRSFDHYLGWLPNADGRQSGLTYTDKQGNAQASHLLAPNFQNCQFRDPDHSYDGGRAQFADGASDGWLRARTDDLFPIGYYGQEDLSFFGRAVPAWTTFDRYFCSFLGPTFPNRFYLHAGQTDRLVTFPFPFATMPTIWDRLAAAGISGSYYFSDAPVTALWGTRYLGLSKLIGRFYEDAAAGALPAVAYLDPRFIGEGKGTSHDDHPLADVRAGQAFLNQVYEALISSPNWESTVLVVTYDEWGGFYDHVPPPMAPLTDLDPQIGNDGRLGFRVPTLLASPLARRGFVGHQQYDHTSVLAMIEWRFGLEPLTVRDATANNLARALDFQSPKNLSAPHFDVPTGPFGGACGSDNREARPEMAELEVLARQSGFAVPDE
jgi:phospholipase C